MYRYIRKSALGDGQRLCLFRVQPVFLLIHLSRAASMLAIARFVCVRARICIICICAYLLLYASGAAAADNHLGFGRTKAFSDALSHTHLQIINQL